jgi:hypothetical protein
MNPIELFARARREESGVAMIIAVVLSGVIATLSLLMLTVGLHSDHATARSRHFTQSLHVAESGIEEAIARIQEDEGAVTAGSFSGQTELGTYDVTITRLARNRYTVQSTGHVRQGGFLATERTIRVTLEPPVSFEKALFSYTTVETKNKDIIEGDVWANHSVILAQETSVTGSVIAALGYIRLNNLSVVQGDAWSGGYDASTSYAVWLDENSEVGGDVTASVQTIGCTGSDNANYKIRLRSGADIGGNVTTWGPLIEGSGTVHGSVSLNTCTSPPPAEELPSFTFAEANYDSVTYFGTPSTSSATAVVDFQNHINSLGKTIQGTYYVNQSDPVNQVVRLDLTDVVIAGDTTIVTNTPIFTNDTSDATSDAIFTLISTYDPPAGTTCDVNSDNSECSMHLKNNFSLSGSTAVLIYAPYGPVAVKNNATQFGAIYADSIQVKNNQEMVYDSRIARVVGFGEVTLEPTDWQEIAT